LLFTDLDECSAENIDRFCPPPGNCTNLLKTYSCKCPDGYKVTSIGCQGEYKYVGQMHWWEVLFRDCGIGRRDHCFSAATVLNICSWTCMRSWVIAIVIILCTLQLLYV